VNICSFIFTVLQALITKLTAKETCLDSNKDPQKQLQATIDGLTVTEEAYNQTIHEPLEKQKEVQATIDGQRETLEEIKQTAQLLCEHKLDVSTRKVEAITTSKLAEKPPAFVIANFRPNNVGS
jgi:phage shock protein A